MRRAWSRLSRPAAAAAAAVLLLGGCSSGSGESAPDRLAPVDAVRAAASATEKAGSSRFDLTVATQVGGQSVDISGTGVYDPATRRGTATIELPQGLGTMEQVFAGDELYLTVPGQPGYYRLSLSDVVGTSLDTGSPTDGLKQLQAVSDDVEEVGTETVRDTETTRYRGSIDAEAALETLRGTVRDAAAKALQSSGATTIPFEAWIDDDGRLRRFASTVELPASDATQGQAVTTTTTLELYDFGVEVSAEPPPADQVQDGAPLIEALRRQQGG